MISMDRRVIKKKKRKFEEDAERDISPVKWEAKEREI